MPYPFEMEHKIAKYLGVEDPDDDPQLVWDVLYDKINNDPASWPSIYRFFFEDYQQERNNRFFDESIVEFFFNFDEAGFYNIIKKVMLRDNLSPSDLPELCAVVCEEFERFHKRFYVEEKQTKDGTINEDNDPLEAFFNCWVEDSCDDHIPSFSLYDAEIPEIYKLLFYHLLMIEILELWQYFPQVLQWQNQTKAIFRFFENSLKSLSSDYRALAPLGYEHWEEHLDVLKPYRLVDRIIMDEHFRIIELDLSQYYSSNDLSPLASLSNLQKLRLGDHPISFSTLGFNVSPLIHLTNLVKIISSSHIVLLCDKNLRDSISCPALLKIKDSLKFV